MKNSDDQRLLAHKRRVDAERRAAAIQRRRDEDAARQMQNVKKIHSMFKG